MAHRKRNSSALRSGSKIEKLYNWLQREMVTSELVFTKESAHTLMSELFVNKPEIVWNMLQYLEERKGLISRKRRLGEKGIIVSFVNKDAESPAADGIKATSPATGVRRPKEKPVKQRKQLRKKDSETLTVDQLLKQVKSDIDKLIEQKEVLEERIIQNGKFMEQLYAVSRR